MTFSIIQKSQLEGALRLDAEYYLAESVFNHPFELGEKVVDLVQYGTSEDLNEDGRGYPVLRLNEFEDYFIKKPEKYCDKISDQIFESLRLKKGDVLICRTNGNPKLVGKSALVMEDTDCAFASYLFRVRPNLQKINASTLVAFLNSKVGRSEIEKYLMPSIQSNFSPARFREIKIPIFSFETQTEVNELFKSAYQLLNISKEMYLRSENLLLEDLGLNEHKIDEKLFSVVNLSEVKTAERMDAEYYQPKYQDLISQIKNKNVKLLEDVIENVPGIFNSKNEPEKVFKYAELSNINSSIGVIDGFSKVSGKEAPSRAKRVLKTGDVIVSSVEGSLGKVALVEKEQQGYLASTGFFQFRSKEILPEVLLVLARSIVFRSQLEQRCAGTILTAVPKESINNILVPVLPDDMQQKIADLVMQSHEARKKAKELLEEAKLKVEQLIEKGN